MYSSQLECMLQKKLNMYSSPHLEDDWSLLHTSWAFLICVARLGVPSPENALAWIPHAHMRGVCAADDQEGLLSCYSSTATTL